MLSLAERIVIMAFIRDWYTVNSIGATDDGAKELRERADNAHKVVNTLYGVDRAGRHGERFWEGES